MLFPLPSDFQNMPNAMRPSAPRPQTFNTIRPTATTNTQVPRMMASQRMRKYFSFQNTESAVFCSSVTACHSVDAALIKCLFHFLHLSHPGPRPAPSRCFSRCRSSARHAPVQICCWCAQPPATHGLPATGPHAAGKNSIDFHCPLISESKTWNFCICVYSAGCVFGVCVD